MAYEEKEEQKLDLMPLIDDFLQIAKRLWILALALMVAFGVYMGQSQKKAYVPFYQAYASFTVRVADPLYASVRSYNEKTAEVMATTFPSILTSGVLQSRVRDELGMTGMPGLAVQATASASVLTLTVTDTDPQRAYQVLEAVITCYPDVAEFVVGPTVLILLDESGVPGTPVNSFSYRPHVIKGAMIGAVLWFALVILLIIAKNTVHNEDELKRIINTPCLGSVPTVRINRKTPCPLLHRHTRLVSYTESIRQLRVRVEREMSSTGRKVLLVSSAIPGEGKTTIALNLAISLAQKGLKVLVIDCDLRNPSVIKALTSKEYPLTNENSVADYLAGGTVHKWVVQRTELENLSIISGGLGTKMDLASAQAQERMNRLIQSARSQFDYVILDTPPCSLLADASELAGLAECGLMVVRQDFAARDQILDGIQRLSDTQLQMIGCVFNNVRKGLSGSYGYGYGYGYGYNYSHGYGSSEGE